MVFVSMLHFLALQCSPLYEDFEGLGITLSTRPEKDASVMVQDLMYRPLGLACGHKFCAPCAFKAAGMGNAVGTMRALLHHTPPLTPCPECRRPGMYARAKELESVGQLIKFRCALPDSIATRCHGQERSEM